MRADGGPRKELVGEAEILLTPWELMRGVPDALRSGKEPALGPATLLELAAAGISTLREVAATSIESLVSTGVQRRLAKQIRSYILRRQR